MPPARLPQDGESAALHYDRSVKIRVLAFASVSDALGAGELAVELADGAGLVDLRRWLDVRYPGLVPLWPRLAVALDGAIAQGDPPLYDGAEVALLPPVSGGSDGDPASVLPPVLARPRVELVETPIDVQDVMARVAAPERGAVLLFLGTVRDHGKAPGAEHRQQSHVDPLPGDAVPAVLPSSPQTVLKLTYTAYRSMALQALDRIATELEAQAPGVRVAIVHRLGDVAAGEASVAIAVAAPHRAAAYEASRQALERLKAEVPIWKREHYAGGQAIWREEEPLTG